MASVHFRTLAVMVAAIALAAPLAFAQREGRRDGGGSGRREGVERAQPRRGGESRRRDRANDNRRSEGPTFRQREGRREGGDSREHLGRNENRPNDGPRYGNRPRDYRAYNGRRYGNRAYGYDAYGRRYHNRAYGFRPHDYRSYGYRPHANRSYVIPYGYRPHGYRRGWSLNLYFGRPYHAYGYPTYDYPAAAYGYYALAPGRWYGALRIVDAPHDAQVFVDGYYAGVVDDYDGVFQHLNLEAGPHHIEVEVPGYPRIAFEVRIEPGQTITYRARLY